MIKRKLLFFSLVLALAFIILPRGLLAQIDGLGNDALLFYSSFSHKVDADFAKGNTSVLIHGQGFEINGVHGQGLYLPQGAYAEIESVRNINSGEGTIVFWFKPNWNSSEDESHTLLSWSWKDSKAYGVFSVGWWEDFGGAGRTYFNWLNTEYAHCNATPLLTKDSWVQVILVWKSGNPGFIAYYLNGVRQAVAAKKFDSRKLKIARFVIGSDLATPESRGRYANGTLRDLVILKKALNSEEVKMQYIGKEQKTTSLLRPPLYPEQSIGLARNKEGILIENRILFDERPHCVTKEEIDRTINTMVRARFNVYVPCLWHGAGALFHTSVAPLEDRYIEQKKHDPSFDPLAYLLIKAHANGIEVHPWICVSLRQAQMFPQWAPQGTPPGFFDVHNFEFRQFIVKLVGELVTQYPVDGIMLDFIRTGGLSKTSEAKESFKKKYQQDLIYNASLKQDTSAKTRILEWQADAIDDIIFNISKQCKKAIPKIIISTAGKPRTPAMGLSAQGRNETRWIDRGWVDIAYDMDYSNTPNYEPLKEILKYSQKPHAYIKILGNYDYDEVGKIIARDPKIIADLIRECRKILPQNGVGIYIYSPSFFTEDLIQILRNGVFAEHAVTSWSQSMSNTESLDLSNIDTGSIIRLPNNRRDSQ